MTIMHLRNLHCAPLQQYRATECVTSARYLFGRDFQYVGVRLCQVEARTINGFLYQYVNICTWQCAPLNSILHHRPVLCTMVHKGDLLFLEVGVTANVSSKGSQFSSVPTYTLAKTHCLFIIKIKKFATLLREKRSPHNPHLNPLGFY